MIWKQILVHPYNEIYITCLDIRRRQGTQVDVSLSMYKWPYTTQYIWITLYWQSQIDNFLVPQIKYSMLLILMIVYF